MKIRKILALTAFTAYMFSSFPFSASANMPDNYELYDEHAVCSYKIIKGEAIITDVCTNGKYFDIPDTIEYDSSLGHFTAPVVGVDDYAFALCKNLEVIYIPETFEIAKTGNVAFLTSSAIENFLDNEIGSLTSFEDIIKYAAIKANFKNGEFTESDLAEAAVKLEKKLSIIDISSADTLEKKLLILIKNIDKMELDPELYNSFNTWISSVTYNGLTLCGNENADEIRKYAEGRGFLNMKYSPIINTDFILGDANNDGKLNVRDAAFIASSVAKGISIELPAADFNNDGKVNVRDAAAIAHKLSNSK